MKVIEHSSDIIEQIGDNQIHDFKIKASAKAFDILSKGIYTNNITPPIRELATNAYDSHIAAGNTDIPFEVHLPSILEPWFSVRDYGVGMNEEEISRIYTTYFESTKTLSNDYVGCLGLGSKSPFCYTDTFSVISIQNGVKLIYTCFLQNGLPKCAKFGEEKTKEPNGMLIQFAVDEKDINTFIVESTKIYNRFIHKPKILNCSTFEYETVDHSYTGNEWCIRKDFDRYRDSSLAIMGNIAYPITNGNLKLSSYGDDSDVYSLINCGVEITFGIGQLEIAANRESLHFDDRTIKNIISKCKIVLNELKNLISKKFDECKDYWEARCLYYEIFHDNSLFDYNLRNVLRKIDISYKGNKINCDIKFCKELGINNSVYYSVYEYGRPSNNSYGDYKARRKNKSSIFSTKNTFFVFNDLKTGGISRIKHYVENNTKKVLVVIEDNTECRKLLKNIGYPVRNVLRTSNMPKAPVTTHVKPQNKNRRVVNELINTLSWDESRNWKETVIDDITDGTYYYMTTISNSMVNTTNSGTYVSNFNSMKQCLIDNNLLSNDTVIYGVPEHRAERIKKLSNWINIFEYANEKLTEIINKQTDKQQIIDYKYINEHSDIRDSLLVFSEILSPDIQEISNLKDIIEWVDKLNTKKDDIVKTIQMYLYTSTKVDSLNPTYEINSLCDIIYDKFPMIQYCGTLSTSRLNENPTFKQHIIDYVKKMS
jgi:hypothetical protein